MNGLPQFRYVRSRNTSIGYSRWGDGEDLVVFTPPFVSNIELMWELPEWERVLRWAGQHHQVIMIDKRGVGLSDRITQPSTLDEYVADVLAVMDAEDIAAAHIVGHSEGGVIGAALSALHPERVRRLCMIGTLPSGIPREAIDEHADPKHPMLTAEENRHFALSLMRTWGTPDSVWLERFAPSVAADERVRRWWQRFERQSCSSGAILAMFRSLESFDVYPMLEHISAPTLVCHSLEDQVVPASVGKTYASIIPEAKFIGWNNPDHVWGFAPNWRESQNDIIEFLLGVRPGSGAKKQIGCILFTDIVGSTKTATDRGNDEWRRTKELHDAISRLKISQNGGTFVKSTGDGCLAFFLAPESAVYAALELTKELSSSRIPIRAGLHMGQFEIQDDGDLSGVAVNIAARIQALAKEGEVLVSQTVHDLLLGTSVVMKDTGKYKLKGIDGSWHVYALAS